MMSKSSAIPAGPFIGFQLKHIGDFLMTLPALGLIKKNLPDEKLTLVVSPKVAELAALHPWVDEVIVLDRQAGFKHFWQIAKILRKKRFETAFVFDGQTRSIITARTAGVKNRIGSSGLYPLGRSAPLYTRNVAIESESSRLDSQAMRGQKMVAGALGLTPDPGLRPPMPALDSSSIRPIAPLLGELEGTGPRIGLTLHGMQYEKSWPLANFAELCRKLWEAFNARLFVTGGPGERPLADSLAKEAGVPVANFCGRTSLPHVVSLAMVSDLFITIDTGTSHLVALTETPLLSIFIWTSPALWPPQSPRAHLMCYEWALERFELKPSDGPWQVAPVITPEMVFLRAADILTNGQYKPEVDDSMTMTGLAG
ncbi:hypothetical protein C4J81_07575 [Deltaproteobacteria bacterium Smac51]|nr:hypothetical protein C4J81_07575 [Deltaproteobacteria bacterium Smac51]